MTVSTRKISPCLWFDNRIEEAVRFYVSVFGGKILDTNYYGEGAPQPKGTVLTVTFVLKDQEFVALNGGPHFKFTEAVSFYVRCETQAEVDNYWNKLTANGGQESQCGWLKDIDNWLDRYRAFWQASLDRLDEYLKELQAKKKPARKRPRKKKS